MRLRAAWKEEREKAISKSRNRKKNEFIDDEQGKNGIFPDKWDIPKSDIIADGPGKEKDI